MSKQGPSGKYNNFNNSFNESANSNSNSLLGRIKTLKCVFCNIEKPLDSFSSTQIQKATFNPYAPKSYNNSKNKVISCKKCTSSPSTHKTCMTCSKTLPLDKFAKSQKKHGEKARCISCIKKREDENIWGTDPDTDDEDDDLEDFF